MSLLKNFSEVSTVQFVGPEFKRHVGEIGVVVGDNEVQVTDHETGQPKIIKVNPESVAPYTGCTFS